MNRQERVRSPALHTLVEELWLWNYKHLLSLSAPHIPGHLNVGAELMSRRGPQDDEWRLQSNIVLMLWELFSRAEMDLFTTGEKAHCLLWFSLLAQDELLLGLDAFAYHPWQRVLYAFPPMTCILP